MAVKNAALTVNFTAWDTNANVGKTGDSANFTLRLIKDGGAAAAPGAAISEPDSTNLLGVYEIALTATEMNADFVTLGGKSSTANIVIIPTYIHTEAGYLVTLDQDASDLKSDLVVIDNAVSDVESSLVIVKSDTLDIEVDTKTTLSAQITTIASDTLAIEVDTQTTLQNQIASILVDTGTTLSAQVTTIASDLVKVYSDTTIIEVAGGLTASAVNAELLDVLNTDTFAELSAVPAATSTLVDKINWMFALCRNRILQTGSVQSLKADDQVTDIATATVSDDGTTFRKAEWT